MSTDAAQSSPGPFDVGKLGDMAHIDMTPGERIQAMPLPSLPAKPGWSTMEAHLGLLFTVAAFIAAMAGFKSITPERIQGGYETILALGTTLGPMVAAAGVLHRLITSRGKFESNKVNATAQIVQAQAQNVPMSVQGLGGFKNPSTWIDLGRAIGGSGVIPGKGGDIVSQILGGDGGATRTDFTDEALKQILSQLSADLKETSLVVTTLITATGFELSRGPAGRVILNRKQ